MPWPTTERFDDALASDHTVVTKAEVLVGEEVVEDLVALGAVVDGSVTVQGGDTERTASLSIIDIDGTLTPRDMDDLLAPTGNQIRLSRGIKFATPTVGSYEDTEEYVPLITARFTSTRSHYPYVELTEMYDRSWIVAGALLENTLVILSGANVWEAVSAVLETAYPGVPTNFPDTDEVCNRMIFDPGTNPWQIARDLAMNVGYRLAFDPLGVATGYSDPDLTDESAVSTFDDTTDSNLASSAEMEWVGQAFNAVLVTSDNSDLVVPVRGLVKDEDPSSPTQYGGKYGRRLAEPIADEKVRTVAQAILRAQTELRTMTGVMQQINMTTMVNPGWGYGDVVVANLTRRAIEHQLCTLDNWSVPMRAKRRVIT